MTVLLPGPFGDLIQCLPAFERMAGGGHTPLVVVNERYSSLLDGVSYVKVETTPEPWQELSALRRRWPEAVAPQFWNDPLAPERRARMGQGRMLVRHRNQPLIVDLEKDPDYGTAMWRRLGFGRGDFLKSVPHFDRRDALRESLLNRQPRLLLYNLKGNSSPFPWTPEVSNALAPWKHRSLDLSRVRAHRLYDLLGLYERSACLLSVDTATAHLAAGSPIPTIWLTQDGWTGSVPRGNVLLALRYSEVMEKLPLLLKTLAGAMKGAGQLRFCGVGVGA